jgi:hypothetical protein
MAVKGTDGTGTGDVVGPNGGVTDGYLVAFNGGTGKLIKQLTPAMVKTLLAYTALDVSFDNSVANLAGAPATVQAAINAVASSGGKNDALFAIEIADLKGQRMGMVGGVADSFDDTTGVAMQNGTDRDTLCLLHFDGANGSTTITDNGSAGATWTPTGAVAVSTNQSKFGGASGIFNAGTNDFVTASPFSESQLKRGDFTIDVWVRPTISTSQIICDFRTTLTNAANLVLYIDATSTPKFAFLAAGTQRIIGTTTAAVNTWYHLALVRYAGVTKMYVNGVQEGVSYTDATYYVAPETGIRLGADYTNSTSKFGGYMDEFRLSKVARWTSNFTPPAAAYSFDANASLNYTYDAAGDLFTPTRILVIDSDGVPQTATSAGSTFTLIDRTNPIANGAVVSALRFFATNAGQYTIKIVRRVSGTVYDVLLSQVVNHPGGGLVEFALTTPFTVPSSGVIYAGVNYGTAVIPNLSNVTIRTYIGSNPAVGNGVTGWTEDSNNFIPMNVVYQPENMTLVSVAYTASSTPNNARIAVQLADSLTLTPNTDFTAEVSRDGGTTWTAVTLSLTMPSFGGVKMYEGSVSVLGQPSGTSMKWRFKTITNKAIFASGVVLQYS